MQLKPKILVIDDSPDLIHILKHTLSHHGYRIQVAEDGETALQKYSALKPDVVTLDLGMSGMNGYQTLQRILEIDTDAKVIIATASPFVTLEGCLKIGAVGLLRKPFSTDDLIRTIDQSLSHVKISH